MMVLREREFTSVDHKPVSFLTEWIAGAFGGLMSIVGLWMYYGPADGILQLFGWDWDVAGLSEAWPFGLIIAGTVVLASVFARLSQRLSADGPTTRSNVSTALSVVSLLVALTFALIWIF